MASLIAFILIACTASANGETLASECVAGADSTCNLEESMRVELLQDRYSMGGGNALAVPSPKVAVAVNASHASMNVSHRSGNLVAVNTSVNVSANASEQQFPDIGSIIGGVADAVSGGGGIGDIVQSVTGGAADALLQPIVNAVNNTLSQLNGQVIALSANVQTERDRLVASADASWADFTIQLNATLEDVLAQFSVVPFNQITSTLDTVGASGILPPQVTDALAQISSIADILANATLLAQQIVNMENLGYAEAAELMATLNGTLYDGLALAQTGTGMLDEGFTDLAANAITSIQNIPGMSILPDAAMNTVQAIFDSASTTVHTIASQTDAAITSLVTGVEQAAVNALGTFPQQPGAQSGASGLKPLLAATLAMSAVACH